MNGLWLVPGTAMSSRALPQNETLYLFDCGLRANIGGSLWDCASRSRRAASTSDSQRRRRC